jgi:hypothetical protein
MLKVLQIPLVQASCTTISVCRAATRRYGLSITFPRVQPLTRVTAHFLPHKSLSILPGHQACNHGAHNSSDAQCTWIFIPYMTYVLTNIQLDNFSPTLAHFLEHIEIKQAKERKWVTMTVVKYQCHPRTRPPKWCAVQGNSITLG